MQYSLLSALDAAAVDDDGQKALGAEMGIAGTGGADGRTPPADGHPANGAAATGGRRDAGTDEVAGAAPSGGSDAEDQIRSEDLDAASAAPVDDGLLAELELAAELAPTFAQRDLAAFLAARRREGEPLPRQGQGYAERVILADAGIPYDVFVQDRGLRESLARFASRFPLVDYQTGVPGAAAAGQTLVGFADRQLDEMERKGVRVMRMHAGRDLPSTQWWADHMGVRRSLVCNNGAIRGRLQRRLKAGTLKLGGVFKDPRKLTKAELRAIRRKLKPVLARHLADRRPIPSHPERSDKIWFEKLFDEAVIEDAHHRDMIEINHTFRLELTKLMNVVGLAPLGTEAARGVEVTYGMLCAKEGDGIGLVRQAYRQGHPDEEAGSVAEDRHVANEISFLNRFRRENERTPEDGVARDFGDAFEEMAKRGHTQSVKGNENYDEALSRWRGIASAIAQAGVFPATFFGAFATAMNLRQMDADTLAETIKAPRKLIYSWRSGRAMPTLQTEHLVIAAETALEVPPGTFTSRLGDLATGRPREGRSHLTLADGREIQLSYWWRRLPEGAAGWDDDRLRPALEDAVARHTKPETVASVRMAASKRNIWDLPEEDPDCLLWREWDDLVRFKRGIAGDKRVQLADDNWNTTGTIGANRTYASVFERWCRLPVDAGGLGLDPSQVSFRLLINPAVGKLYLVWRATRSAHLELKGETIGIQVTSTEKAIAGFFSGLLEGDFGWITQSEAELGVPEPIATSFRLPSMVLTNNVVEIIDDDTCPTAEVMPDGLVARLGSDWRGAVAEARLQARVLKSNFALKFKLIRDPKDLIGPIVRHTHPMAVLLRMIREALKRVRPLETSPTRHARDYQRIVAALLLALVVFRSETLRGLTWRRNGTGQLRWVEGRMEHLPDGTTEWLEPHYDVVVGADHFKNVTSVILFGPSWNRRDYERELRDWGGLDGILKHFTEVCRPILLDGRESDLLLPPPKPQRASTKDKISWSDADFNYLITGFTGMWCVYNRRFGTGMPGVRSFGPHPFRDIIATHILKHWKGEERWELAARVLGTGIQQVRDRYGWIDTRAELGRVDPIFDEASRLAMSDAPLWHVPNPEVPPVRGS